MKQSRRRPMADPSDLPLPNAAQADSQQPAGDCFGDIVLDILGRFAELLHARVDEFRDLEEEIRREWGGCNAYVLKVGISGRAAFSRRNDRIRAEHQRGEHVELLARRHGLTVRRVRQIVASA